MTSADFDTAPRNWITTAMFALTFAVAVTVVPWYGFAVGYHAAAWVWFTLLLGANGMAITCGYHRLFSHATYEAHPVLKVAYLLFGAMALQNSALVWSAGHRSTIASSMTWSGIRTAHGADSGSPTLDGCCTIIRAANRTSAWCGTWSGIRCCACSIATMFRWRWR